MEGHNTQEGKVWTSCLNWCDGSFPFPAGDVLWSRGRKTKVLRRNDTRGAAPRGVPLAGRSKTLKGEPQGRCGGRRAVARQRGEQVAERVVKP